MKCPYCSFEETKVIDSRESENGSIVRRRRECIQCRRRFTTYERIERNFNVVKKDRRREPYTREKIMKGIQKACEKRPLSQNDIEGLVDEIENNIQDMGKTEIESEIIGDLVMEKLRDIDKIAYIRFSCVYKEFDDLDLFLKEIEKVSS
ncbi:MAG: transcriptional repressor NrdR [Theionarchaea archaeon]|nr:transcriptional repressor NrdR [Theionarchaea archaeon]